ncbi:MAG TPA: hypothetical protein VFB14_12390 [Bryobacteraceae bacterium]|jgi:hypothetical protein|nr:hypothetical protein [Bryobacteraceae bacterium]
MKPVDTEFKAASSDHRFRTGHAGTGDFALGRAAAREARRMPVEQFNPDGTALYQRHSVKAVALLVRRAYYDPKDRPGQ